MSLETAHSDHIVTNPKKNPRLRQWLVTAHEPDGTLRQEFLLATCGKRARQYFTEKFPEAKILIVMQSAVSEKTAAWLETHSPFM